MERNADGKYCFKELVDRASLNRHKKAFHSDQEPLECDLCPEPEEGEKQKYHSQHALNNHKRDKHGKNANKRKYLYICKNDRAGDRSNDRAIF